MGVSTSWGEFAALFLSTWSAFPPRELTYCFLRLGNLDCGAFERLGRYNTALWKQTAQTLLLLGSARRR
jgi:hypothetical protein